MKNILLGIVGLLVGGFVGFQLRPSAFLVGQLPFETVLTRGANLRGFDLLLVSTAQTSFNYMLAGAALGAACGLAVALLSSRRSAQQAGMR
jgi:ABC-type nitrate/sulfonate/bicarbonate transport system permease component